jgi:hypothetical protein
MAFRNSAIEHEVKFGILISGGGGVVRTLLGSSGLGRISIPSGLSGFEEVWLPLSGGGVCCANARVCHRHSAASAAVVKIHRRQSTVFPPGDCFLENGTPSLSSVLLAGFQPLITSAFR